MRNVVTELSWHMLTHLQCLWSMVLKGVSRKVCVLWFLVPGGAAMVQGYFEKLAIFFDVSRRRIAKPSAGHQLLTMSLKELSSSCDKPCGSGRKAVQLGRNNSYSLIPDTFFMRNY